MSKALANQLMNAESLEAFLDQPRRQMGWKMFAALKLEVDRLVYTDLNIASRLVERLEQLAQLTDDEISKAFAEASRGRLLHLFGQHAKAYDFYESAIKTLQGARLIKEAAMIQKQQIDTLTETGRYTEALRVARSARRVLAQSDPVQLAQLEINVGNIYYRLDRYKQALEYYNKARDIFAGNGESSMRAHVALSISNVCTEIDRPDEAIALLESAAKSWGRVGQKLKAAQARSKIAYIKFLRGNYTAALTSYYQIREQISAIGGTELVTWCDLEIAEILLALNAFDDAAESAALARSGFAQLGLPYESAQATIVCALAAMGAGQFQQTESFLKEAREVFAQNQNANFVAQIDLYLAELALKQNDALVATQRAENSLRLFARQKLLTKAAYSRLLIARAAYQSQDYATAKRLAKLALRAIEKHIAPTLAYQCHHLLGKIARHAQQPRAALESFRRAIAIIEPLRGAVAADEFKASFLRDKIEVYEDAISACLDEGGKPGWEEAFHLVESSKSRALADLLARQLRGTKPRKGKSGDSETEAREQLAKLLENLNWYSAQTHLENEKGGQRRVKVLERYDREIEKCERQIAQLFRRMEAAGSAFAEFHQMQAIPSADLREALEEGENLIEYFTTGDEVSAFIASRDEMKLVRGIASKREVERTMSALNFQLEKFNYGAQFADEHFEQLNHAINQHLIEIYRQVFAVLEPQLNCQKLIIIPHGALHYVPFHALLDRRGYLIDRFEISYAPSAAVLRLCRKRGTQMRHELPDKPSGKGLRNQPARNDFGASTALANMRLRKGDVVAFGVADRETPNIEAEIHTLKRIFPEAITLLGDQATRSNLMKFAPSARFLHLASHSYFRRDNPMFSFLQLADSPLHFYNLMDLQLQAEMVTLSACHTGMNMIFPGDELHGLMRGFLYAGAPSLVASLWAANDISTAQFMDVMYSRLSLGDTKRAAIRAAQLAIKDAYGHPYYWAPFVLMGNPN
ncbi:MAG: CHAT domain-containing protein [Acidobacteria bacterium]|nr:CHAT domain-containing protein [Acidobacteriota bacterium]